MKRQLHRGRGLSLILLCSLLAALAAQDSSIQQQKKQEPPKIPIEDSAEYFAAAAEVNALSVQLEKAQAKFEAAKTKVINDCGKDHAPNLQVASKPRCDPKPKAEEKK